MSGLVFLTEKRLDRVQPMLVSATIYVFNVLYFRRALLSRVRRRVCERRLPPIYIWPTGSAIYVANQVSNILYMYILWKINIEKTLYGTIISNILDRSSTYIYIYIMGHYLVFRSYRIQYFGMVRTSNIIVVYLSICKYFSRFLNRKVFRVRQNLI